MTARLQGIFTPNLVPLDCRGDINEPEHMVAFRIHAPPKDFPYPSAWKNTWSVATMTDLGDGTTRLRLASMGYDTSDESQNMREFFSTNNAYVLKVLQSHFDAATPAPAKPEFPEHHVIPSWEQSGEH